MRLSPFTALFLGSLLAAVGQLFLKRGADGASSLKSFLNVYTGAGLAAYAIGTLLWIWSLSKVPLNVAYGFTALTFVFVFLGSGAVLGERFSYLTYLGLALVIAGFVCLSLAPRPS